MLNILAERTIRGAVYEEERKLFDAQSKGSGYSRPFSYTFWGTTKVNGTPKIKQQWLVTGRATCNCSFGFNTYVEIEEIELDIVEEG